MDVARRIRDLRTQAGLSQQEVAAAASIAQPFLSLVERRRLRVDAKTIEAIETAIVAVLEKKMTAYSTVLKYAGQGREVSHG